jgi:hypothetical protein
MANKIRSFRLDDATMKKLDAIRAYHQQFINLTCQASQVDIIPLSRAMIVKRLIEQEHTNMLEQRLVL